MSDPLGAYDARVRWRPLLPLIVLKRGTVVSRGVTSIFSALDSRDVPGLWALEQKQELVQAQLGLRLVKSSRNRLGNCNQGGSRVTLKATPYTILNLVAA